MRILFCTNSLGAVGGIEKVTIVKANAFSEIPGNEVAICYTDRGTFPQQTMVDLSDKVKTFDLGVTFWDLYPLNIKNLLITAPKKFIALRRELKRVIRDFNPDVVITTGSYEKFGLATICPDKLLHKPAIKIREYHFNSNYRRYINGSKLSLIFEWLENNLLRHMFDMSFLLTKEDLQTNFANKSNMNYQYNPCYLIDDNVSENKRSNTIATVCRLEDQKNISAMLRIWSKIHTSDYAKDWHLLIVGDGSKKAELEQLAKELDILSSVTFTGYRRDIGEILSHVRIIAITSKYEGFALNILEGMQKGAIPVSYRTPYGPADLITDGVNGVLVDYNNEQLFADKLLELIKNPERIDSMIPHAKARVKDFTPEKIAKDWMVKYRALLDKKH